VSDTDEETYGFKKPPFAKVDPFTAIKIYRETDDGQWSNLINTTTSIPPPQQARRMSVRPPPVAVKIRALLGDDVALRQVQQQRK